jgi:hypothetical protein
MLFVDLLGYVYPLAEVVRLPPLTHNQSRCFNVEVVGFIVVLFHIFILWLFARHEHSLRSAKKTFASEWEFEPPKSKLIE